MRKSTQAFSRPINVPIEYIVQGHCFNIIKDMGCVPFTYNTPPAFVIVYSQPITIGCISAVYSALSIRHLYKRKTQFNELLSRHSNLSSNRYFRFMCLASVDVIFTIPLATYALISNYKEGAYPWLGWKGTHYGFSRVDQFPHASGARTPGRTSQSSVPAGRMWCAPSSSLRSSGSSMRPSSTTSRLLRQSQKVGYSTFTRTSGRSGAVDTTINGGSLENPGSFSGMNHRQCSIDLFNNISVPHRDDHSLGDEKKTTCLGDAFVLRLSLTVGTLSVYNSDNGIATTSQSSISLDHSSERLSNRNAV